MCSQVAARRDDRPAVAWWPVLVPAGVLAVVLIATSGRYGFSRDELYFVQAGHHLAPGYVDQPPLTPVVARLTTSLLGGSLVGLRLPSAIAAAVVVVLTALLARELGGDRFAQVLAATSIAVGAVTLAVGHLLTTSTFDLLAWSAVSLLAARALRLGGGRSWWWVGLATGVGLENKWLVGFLTGALLLSLLVVGPRSALRGPWPWLAAVTALAVAAPDLVWQAVHGWPQLDVSQAIAAGGSGTSQPRWVFPLFQLVLVSPVLVPVWLAGLVRLLRASDARCWRAFGVAYLLLAVVFVASGAKPYYLYGLYPVLLAAGAPVVLRWVARSGPALRRRLVRVALVLAAATSAFLFLPLVPVEHLAATPVVTVNPDAGETVGWPRYTRAVAEVVTGLPDRGPGTVLLTQNYGEAGALDHDRRLLSLPPVYSGHNGYGSWGPPPEVAGPVVVVGYDAAQLHRWFASVQQAATLDNGVGLDDEEQGVPVWVCRGRVAPWAALWPSVRRLG
jgi:hypothetical protein